MDIGARQVVHPHHVEARTADRLPGSQLPGEAANLARPIGGRRAVERRHIEHAAHRRQREQNQQRASQGRRGPPARANPQREGRGDPGKQQGGPEEVKALVAKAEHRAGILDGRISKPGSTQAHQREVGQHDGAQRHEHHRQAAQSGMGATARQQPAQRHPQGSDQRQHQQRHPGQFQRQRRKTVPAGAPDLGGQEGPEIGRDGARQAHVLPVPGLHVPARQVNLHRAGQAAGQQQHAARAAQACGQRRRRPAVQHPPQNQPAGTEHHGRDGARDVGQAGQQTQRQHTGLGPAPGPPQRPADRRQQRQQRQRLVIRQVLLTPVAA